MEKSSEKEKNKLKWETPTINKFNFNKSEGKFGTFAEATDEEGNQIGS